MKREEILLELCYYDNRNPDNLIESKYPKNIKSRDECVCDNCFYGRHKLSNYILQLEEKLGVIYNKI